MSTAPEHASQRRRHTGLRQVRRATGQLATIALQRLDETLPWYRAMPPEDRSWVGLVAQAGITAFTSWYEHQEAPPTVTADVFGTAPRELTRSVTLSQTLQLVRTVVEVVEENVVLLAPPGRESSVREAVLRYSREVAFGAAEIYAQAAEARGAWDARLEALVVDALLRGDTDDALQSRVAALGWQGHDAVAVVVGNSPSGTPEDAVAEVRRAAQQAADDALVGVRGDRLVVVLGSSTDPQAAADALAPRFGPGPVVVGPVVPGLSEAGRSARTALAGLVAARAWPQAPRPVHADDLLPERVLSGDVTARRALLDRVYRPLRAAGGALEDTVSTYLEHGRSLEAAARTLFVHPNTVRYRLRRVADVTGWDATSARDAYVLQIGLTIGLLADGPSRPAPETGVGTDRSL
ncbi:MAG TPA: helix-turn-helix domain-containing protein [Actinomycetales bacterium]|nr:helix-turn-helix domain-containing protein [Actinomycetales bacterium]